MSYLLVVWGRQELGKYILQPEPPMQSHTYSPFFKNRIEATLKMKDDLHAHGKAQGPFLQQNGTPLFSIITLFITCNALYTLSA